MPIQASGITPLLQVFDMRASVAFYRDVLGFEVVRKHEPDRHLYWAMLRLGGAVVMLNAKFEDDHRPAARPARTPPGHEDVTLYFSCPDDDEAYAHVRATGVDASPPAITYYGMKQLTIVDADGFRLAFQQPA
jgi:catechol 2,3-dioxygenase-like lactoylglutathione lyase family enzyme